MRLVPVDGAELEVDIWGSGEPVVLLQTALTADEFLPLASQPLLADSYRLIRYHRRGYAGSSPVHGPGSIRRDAADCQALLAALGIEQAHAVGVSYSAAVALQLAADFPARVRTLTLLEPPPVHVPSAATFRAANIALVDDYRAHGELAVDRFLARLVGPDWRSTMERAIPGASAQVERDSPTFFSSDIPALLAWRFGPADARRVTQPALHIGGSDSGPWFAEVRDLVLAWLPHAEDVVITGADHNLAITHPGEIAAALVSFLRRHPLIPGDRRSTT